MRGRGEIAYCEWLTLPPEIIVKSQSLLPLRVISGSMAIQPGTTWLPRGCVELAFTPHCLWCSGELAPTLISSSNSHYLRLARVAQWSWPCGHTGEPAQGYEHRSADTTTHVP